jgi:uncharacterized protein
MKRIDTIRRKATAGDAHAQAELGWLYDQGQVVRKSYRKAFQWYLKAARRGNRVAQYNLNLCYLHGQGIAPDEKQAFRWVLKSAQAGYPDAVLALAWHYHNGRGVRVNLRQAEHWYRKLAQSGDPSAQFSLGQLSYDNGRYASAKKWFLKGVGQNHPRCNYYLGRMYLAGLGVRKDATTARFFLRKAINLRDHRAMRLLQSKRLKKELASQKRGQQNAGGRVATR